MNFFIQIKDGNAYEHPIADWNLKMFYPDLDPLNPPEGFEKFNRTTPPEEIGKFQKVIAKEYIKLNGVWSDNWEIVDMTEQEKQEKIKFIKENFLFKETWKFDEENYEWIPPIPYPNDGKLYDWDNQSLKWIEIGSMEKITDSPPNDGSSYYWDSENKKWTKLEE